MFELLNKKQLDLLQGLPDYPEMIKMPRNEFDGYAARYGLTMKDLQQLKRCEALDYGYVGPGPTEAFFFLQKGVNAADLEREYTEHLQEQKREKRTERRSFVSLLISIAALVSSVVVPLVLRSLG